MLDQQHFNFGIYFITFNIFSRFLAQIKCNFLLILSVPVTCMSRIMLWCCKFLKEEKIGKNAGVSGPVKKWVIAKSAEDFNIGSKIVWLRYIWILCNVHVCTNHHQPFLYYSFISFSIVHIFHAASYPDLMDYPNKNHTQIVITNIKCITRPSPI